MAAHLIDGEFQSDKYPTTPRGKVPLSVKDPMAQDLLWEYAQRRRVVDAEFSDDLETALRNTGFMPPSPSPPIDLAAIEAEIARSDAEMQARTSAVAFAVAHAHAYKNLPTRNAQCLALIAEVRRLNIEVIATLAQQQVLLDGRVSADEMRDVYCRRAEAAESALATARRDALEEAAKVAERHSKLAHKTESIGQAASIAAAIRTLADKEPDHPHSTAEVAMSDAVPIPMILTCPACGERHIDKDGFATKSHHTHACQNCGMVWRPAIVPTVGVQFLPGFKDRTNDCHY